MNCGAGLKGPYCHVCGQRDDDFRRPFLALGAEFASDVFAFDSRIFRSVPPFLLAPGALTRSFMKGKRGKYVSPLRLYFVITLVFFAVLAATDVAIFKIRIDADRLERLSTMVTDDGAAGNVRLDESGNVNFELDLSGPARVAEAETQKEAVREIVEGARKSARERTRARTGESDAAKDREVPDQAAASDTADGRAKTGDAPVAAPAPPVADNAGTAAPRTRQSAEDLEKRLQEEIRTGGFPVHVAFFSRIEEDENFEGLPANWKEDLAEQIEESEGTEKDKRRLHRYVAAVEAALVNPRAFNQIFNTWIPRILIIVVPLFALLTSFLYGRKKRLPRRVYYIDHLVFSIYFHSFIFFLMLLLVLKAEWIGNVWDGTLTAQLFFLIIAAYLFVGMKQAFGQGYFKTTVKFVFLYSFYFITLAVALFSLLIVGVLSLPVTP